MQSTIMDRCAVCGTFDFNYQDEVSGTSFCVVHAGPLAWHSCAINEYSIAVRLAGHLDVPVEQLRARA